ncbi:MAG: restriction endonuclease [Candidatus Dormiibacterota bacterium]
MSGPVNLTVMSGEELERHLTTFFGRRGYTVWPTSARGEVSPALLLCRDDQGVVVQVKRWNTALGPEVVRAILEGIRHHAETLRRLGCSRIGGLVVSTAQFKPEARELAERSGVLLWDREALETQLRGEAPAQTLA